MNGMIDLETLGTKQGYVIMSIGIAIMNNAGEIVDEYYSTFNFQENVNTFKVDFNTVMWWLDDERISTFKSLMKSCSDKEQKIIDTLKCVGQFIHKYKSSDEGWTKWWGNSASFDLGLLSYYYDHYNLHKPWDFWYERCFRTEKDGFKDLEPKREGTFHNALDDAKHQCRWLHAIQLFKQARSAAFDDKIKAENQTSDKSRWEGGEV